MADPIRVRPCSACGEAYCQCPTPPDNPAVTDHPRAFADIDLPRAFAEMVVAFKPAIAVRGTRLALVFDTPVQAEGAYEWLWYATNSVKPASAAKFCGHGVNLDYPCLECQAAGIAAPAESTGAAP